MTISSTGTQVQYIRNAVTTQYAFNNKIFAASDMVLNDINPLTTPPTIVPLVLNTDYTVQNVDVDSGCQVTMTTAGISGHVLDIRTQTPEIQSTSIKNQGSFYPELHEEFFDRATRMLQDLTRLTYTYGIHGPDNESVPWPALPVPAQRKNLTAMYDANGLPTVGTSITQSLTRSLIGQFLYPQTVAETTAGVTVIDFGYPPMYVDRYATNTTPGTTDMSAAFTAAWAVARVAGGRIRYGATAPYAVLNPINCTNANVAVQFGISVVCETGPQSESLTGASIIANHTGHLFDLTGSTFFVFENVSIGQATNSPKTAFFQSRVGVGSAPSVGVSRFKYCSVIGSFSVAVYYNYAAEDDQLDGCYFENTNTGSTAVLWWTGNNIAAQASTFQTVSTGNQSCIDHKWFGGEIYNKSGSATSDCVRLDTSDTVKINGPWMLCGNPNTSNGRALVYIDQTNGASNWLTLYAVTAENAAFQQNYGVLVSNNAGTPEGMTIDGSKLLCNIACLAAVGATPTLDNAHIRLTTTAPGTPAGIIWPGIVSNSIIQTNDMPVTIGTFKQSAFIGDSSQLTVTTPQSLSILEMGATNHSFAPGVVTGVNGFTLVGALTQRGKFQKIGNEVSFSIILGPSTSIAWTANATIPGLPGAATDSFRVTVTDFTTGAISGGTLSAAGATSTITLPVAVTTTPHTQIIEGRYFIS